MEKDRYSYSHHFLTPAKNPEGINTKKEMNIDTNYDFDEDKSIVKNHLFI